MNTLPLQQISPSAASLMDGKVKTVGSGFGEVLKKSIDSVNGNVEEANNLASGLVSGQHSNIHETMIAIEKADVSFKLMTKVQQKAIASYEVIMRMQL
ncbi:MAG: flagellar hook-basal body complex protein FliE [Thermodesulfobacteriota bacterium]|nr:flagellar hook-basal body complex protein FliE [Thermodesulfobacteriota bacterium]